MVVYIQLILLYHLDLSKGLDVYRRTLIKIFETAVYKLYSKDFTITINHNVNNGY